MTFDQYRAIDAVNFSSLKHLHVGQADVTDTRLCVTSPMRYRYHKDHPSSTKPSDAMKLGSATHTAVLEPDRFPLEYMVWSGGTRKGPKWDAFVESLGDRTDLTELQYERALAIRDAVRSHPIASAYLSKGEAEKTIQWTDQATGLKCKGRLDWLSRSFPCIVDLKTTRDISPHAFASDSARRGYHRQLAMYCAGAMANGLILAPRAVIIAVEQLPPHEVVVYTYDADALKTGADEIAELLAVLKACQDSDHWPNRYATEQTLALPSWMDGSADISFEEAS